MPMTAIQSVGQVGQRRLFALESMARKVVASLRDTIKNGRQVIGGLGSMVLYDRHLYAVANGRGHRPPNSNLPERLNSNASGIIAYFSGVHNKR